MRNDEGYWNSLENYLSNHSDAMLSHSVCPECYKKLTLEMEEKEKERILKTLFNSVTPVSRICGNYHPEKHKFTR